MLRITLSWPPDLLVWWFFPLHKVSIPDMLRLFKTFIKGQQILLIKKMSNFFSVPMWILSINFRHFHGVSTIPISGRHRYKSLHGNGFGVFQTQTYVDVSFINYFHGKYRLHSSNISIVYIYIVYDETKNRQFLALSGCTRLPFTLW